MGRWTTEYPSSSTTSKAPGRGQYCRQSRRRIETRIIHIGLCAFPEVHIVAHTSALDQHCAVEKHADTRDRSSLVKGLGRPRECFEGRLILSWLSKQFLKPSKKHISNLFYGQGFLVIEISAVFFLEPIGLHLQGIFFFDLDNGDFPLIFLVL